VKQFLKAANSSASGIMPCARVRTASTSLKLDWEDDLRPAFGPTASASSCCDFDMAP